MAASLALILDCSFYLLPVPPIGLFTSTLSKNQIVAFILSVFIVFILYYGFDALANSFQQTSYTIQLFGIHEHYKSISRGVIDTKRSRLFFLVLSSSSYSSPNIELPMNRKTKHLAVYSLDYY